MASNPLRCREPEGNTPQLTEWGCNSEYGVLTDVLLGPADHFHWLPTSSISRATLKRGDRFDAQLAMKQHREMVDAYEEAGVKVHWLEADRDLPYQVFARDSSFMTPYGAVVTQMAQWWRRGEYGPVIRFYVDNGIPIFDMVTAGSFEGGDFDIIEPGCVLIGWCGERTQEQSAHQVSQWFEREGWEVRVTPIAEHYVHIDLMVCMLAEKLCAVCLDTTEPATVDWLKAKGIEIVPVNYPDTMALACNVVSLGNDRVIAPAHARDLVARLKALGFTVYDPDVDCYTRGGGGVHCMAQSLRREPV
ncbi:MAG: arginine deiminase family protein [bacterium]|nr:arginine deiminase family protein [bacterium]MDE0239002.1 arginine deiminase family protein [bacterium]MDE0416393.1 arginine deiminase family protein [bacterium]